MVYTLRLYNMHELKCPSCHCRYHFPFHKDVHLLKYPSFSIIKCITPILQINVLLRLLHTLLRENFIINLLLLCPVVAWLLFRLILLWRSYIFPPVAEVVPYWSLYISSLLKIVIAFSFNYLSSSLRRHRCFISVGTSYNEKQKKETYTGKKTRCFCPAASVIYFCFQQSKKPHHLNIPIFPYLFLEWVKIRNLSESCLVIK